MSTSFDTVRQVTGVAAGPDLVAAIDSMSLEQVDALTEAILDLPITSTLPRRPVTEIWPMIPLRSSLFFDHLNHQSPASGYAPSGIQLSAATDPRPGSSGVFSAGVIRALLYSHGLVIEDPLRHAAEMHASQHADIRQLSRLGLSAAAKSLSEISDLLDADVVTLVNTGGNELMAAGELGDTMLESLESDAAPYSMDDAWNDFEVEFVSGLSLPLQALWSEVRGGSRAPDLGLVRQAVESGDSIAAENFIDVLRILNPRSIVQNAIASTACTVAAIHLLGGACDLLCASPLMGRLLFLGTPDPTQQLRVQEIARTAVPNIAALSPRDLVAIRQASDALATWRHDLANALDFAERVRRGGADSDTVQAGVEEILADARECLQREARKTRIWGSESLVNFVAGGLGGVAGAALGGSTAAIATGAGSGILAAFVQTVGQRQTVPTFLDRHYVAFARPTP